MPTRAQQDWMKARRQADEWNSKYDVGQRVRVRRDSGEVVDTVTVGVARVIGGVAVCDFQHIPGCYALDRASPITTPKVLAPSPALLCKLGSVIVHAEELRSPGGHAFDKAALDSLLSDPEVSEWLGGMRALALIPEKRS